jgi:hypothetical protein
VSWGDILEVIGAVSTLATVLGHVIPGSVGSAVRRFGIDLKGLFR